MRGKNGVLYAGCLLAALFLLACSGALEPALAALRGLAPPFLWAGLLAVGLRRPVAFWEGRLRFAPACARRVLALGLCLAVLLTVLGLVVVFVAPGLVRAAEGFAARLPQLRQSAARLGERLLSRLPQTARQIQTALKNRPLAEQLTRALQNLPNQIVGGAAALGSAAADLALGLVLACYLLLCREKLSAPALRLVRAWLPPRGAAALLHAARLTGEAFTSFVTGQCREACILGALFALVLTVCRMPESLLISALIALTALVPIVGSFVGCGLGTLMILAVSPSKAVWFVVLFLCVQQMEGALIYPRVVGHSVGLPPVLVFVSVLVGGRLFGAAGILAGIPLASVARTLVWEATARRERRA